MPPSNKVFRLSKRVNQDLGPRGHGEYDTALLCGQPAVFHDGKIDDSQKGGNIVQVIYAASFILLSLVSYLICLAVPRLRRHALQALVVPVAFGFCAIVGVVALVLAGDTLTERFHFDVNPGPLVGMKGILTGFVIYFVPGILGAWLAVHLVNKIKQRFQVVPPRT